MALKLYSPDDNVIEGWNRKLEMSSIELSGLTPFCFLFAIYKETDIKKIFPIKNTNEEKEFKKRTFKMVIKGDDSGVVGNNAVDVISIGRIESQLQSDNYMGGIGINSLGVERGSKHSLNVRYNMDITITDPTVFDVRPELRTLIQLNSLYLIVYGWSSNDDRYFVNFNNKIPVNGNIVIDLKDDHYGYWKAALVSLYKFDFSFDNVAHLDCKLNFIAPNNSTLTFMRTTSVMSLMKQKLGIGSSESMLEITTQRRRSIAERGVSDQNKKAIVEGRMSKIPEKIGIGIAKFSSIENEKLDDKDKRIKFEGEFGTFDSINLIQIPKLPQYITPDGTVTLQRWRDEEVESSIDYLYLGWVLEALAESIKETSTGKDEKGIDIKFNYRNVETTKINDMFFAIIKDIEENQNVDIKIDNTQIDNVFQIPLDKSAVESILTTTNAPIAELIRTLIDRTTHLIPGIYLETRMNDNSIEILVASIDYDNISTDLNQVSIGANKKYMDIVYGSTNSLCESIDMTSKLDPNAFQTYQIPVPTGDNTRSLTEAIGKAELGADLLEFARNDPETSALNIRRYSDIIDNHSTVVQKFINSDSSYYFRIIREMFNTNNVFGFLLGYYLKRTTVTIHGHIGINAFNIIRIGGLIKGLTGVYNVLQVTEQLNANSFTTILEASLIDPNVEKTSNTNTNANSNIILPGGGIFEPVQKPQVKPVINITKEKGT